MSGRSGRHLSSSCGGPRAWTPGFWRERQSRPGLRQETARCVGGRGAFGGSRGTPKSGELPCLLPAENAPSGLRASEQKVAHERERRPPLGPPPDQAGSGVFPKV